MADSLKRVAQVKGKSSGVQRIDGVRSGKDNVGKRNVAANRQGN